MNWGESTRMALRTAQTVVPGLGMAKAWTQRRLRLLRRQPFEADFEAIPMLGLPAGALCLDIGANRGQSIDAIRKLTDLSVIAFEPNGPFADKLVRQYRRDPRVRVMNLGLSDSAGSATLYVPIYNGFMFDGLASFDRGKAELWLERRIFRFRRDRLEIRPIDCELARLDDLGLAPAFAKLDIQGYEFRALVGGRDTIERHLPALLIESPDEPTLSLLADLGYASYAYIEGRLERGSLGRLNTFFLHPQGPSQVGRVGTGAS